MNSALPDSGNLDQQTGLVIMVYYICAFPGSMLNGYLVKGSTNYRFTTLSLLLWHDSIILKRIIGSLFKVDKYKRLKLITCIWSASAVVGFSGGVLNWVLKPFWLLDTLTVKSQEGQIKTPCKHLWQFYILKILLYLSSLLHCMVHVRWVLLQSRMSTEKGSISTRSATSLVSHTEFRWRASLSKSWINKCCCNISYTGCLGIHCDWNGTSYIKRIRRCEFFSNIFQDP